jgi:hypothetical protein
MELARHREPVGESKSGDFEWAQYEDTRRIFTPEGEIAQVVVGVKKNRPRWVWIFEDRLVFQGQRMA